MIIMAMAIKDIPVLTGAAARSFIEKAEKAEKECKNTPATSLPKVCFDRIDQLMKRSKAVGYNV